MEAKTSSQMAEVFGKLLAGSFIYESEENRSTNLKRSIAKAKKWLGENEFKSILNSPIETLKAPAYACIEMAIVGKLSPETKQLFRSLDPSTRIVMETLYLKLTGQDPVEQKNDRWNDTMWKLKSACRRYMELSPSEVKEEELTLAIKEIAIPFMVSMQAYFQKIV